MRFKWRQCTPFASTIVCIFVGVVGIVLLLHHPKVKSAMNTPLVSMPTQKTPPSASQTYPHVLKDDNRPPTHPKHKSVAPLKPAIEGSENTYYGNGPVPSIHGNGNTIVGPTDANGNTILNRGGLAIGDRARADPSSIAMGAHANAGRQQTPPITQESSGPNSPNIVGNGNQVTYSDTSELKPLSDHELSEFSSMLSGTKYKLMIRFNGADQDAEMLANQIVNIAKNTDGWDAGWMAGLGGGPVLKVPILVAVKDVQTAKSNEAQAMLRAISAAEGYRIPAIIDDKLVNASNEVDIFLQSRPIKSNP